MKKIQVLFVLLLLLSIQACTGDAQKKDKSQSDATTDQTTQPKASTTDVEELKKTDVKAYTRTKYDKIVSGFQSPESVITDGEYFYVSNVGAKLAPSEKDADGFISKLDKEGNILELKWIAGDDLHAPKGMAIVKGVLYVTDIDKIRGFDMKTKKKVFELDFTPMMTKFLNDLTVKDDNTLFVSATDIGYVFTVDLRNGGAYEVLDIKSDQSGVNGLYYDKAKNELLLCSFGLDGAPIGMVGVCPLDKQPLKQKTIGIFKGFLDGLQLVADQMVLVTDWQDFEKGGNLILYDLLTEDIVPVLGGLIGGPADFYYDASTKKVWLPAMKDNELIITEVKVPFEHKDQGTLINSSGGYEVRTKDKIEFPELEDKEGNE
ncbi:MAG TPA: hypothetical protein ENJ45_04540 [Phaeodactylibacter sp.]|nr:hypothetical protein [Phaeodactylibacter sp.]